MKDSAPHQQSIAKVALGALVLCLVLRIILLQAVSIIDPSEGRWAAASARMLQTGNYLVPEIPDRNGAWEVFWSKPVLQYWNTALSIKLFGVHNWTPRLPAFVSACLILLMVYLLARDWLGRERALLAALICFTSVGFFSFCGAALSDMTLAACASAAFFSMWRHTQAPDKNKQTLWGVAYFASLGLGVMTKGPVCIVMVGFGLIIWSLLSNRWSWLKTLPWFLGFAAFFLIIGPWFYAAEQRSPGYMKYFLFSENFGRFMGKEFGNLYGSTGHPYPRGFAWIMIIAAFAPWSLVLAARLGQLIWKSGLRAGVGKARSNPQLAFALGWGLGPVAFLGLSQNLVPTYLLPAFGGLSLTLALVWAELDVARIGKIIVRTGVVMCFAAAVGVGISSEHINGRRSSERLFRAAEKSAKPGDTLVIFNRLAFSSFFYLGPTPTFNIKAGVELEDLDASTGRLFGFQKRDEGRLPAGFLDAFGERQDLGSWVLYTRKDG